MMARIVALDSGEAFLFAPSGITRAKSQYQNEGWEDAMGRLAVAGDEPGFGGEERTWDVDPSARSFDYASQAAAAAGAASGGALEKLGLRYIKIKIRRRITVDGGMSVLAMGR